MHMSAEVTRHRRNRGVADERTAHHTANSCRKKPDSAKDTKQDARKAAPDLADIFPFSVSVGSVYDGPLDLLLDLIRKQDIDIYDIPIAQITAQYLAYVEHIRNFDIDLAAEFIYIASLLIQIKSKMLLPRDPDAPARRAGPAPRTGQSSA